MVTEARSKGTVGIQGHSGVFVCSAAFHLMQQALRDDEEEGPLSWVPCRQRTGGEMAGGGEGRGENRQEWIKVARWVGDTIAS